MKLDGCDHRVVGPRQGQRFRFIGLQEMDIPQEFLLPVPVYRKNIFALHFAEITLRVNGNTSLLRQVGYYFEREIVGQQATQMENLCLQVLQVFNSKGVCLCQYMLGTVILVLAINILEINRLARRHYLDQNTFATQFVNYMHIFGAQCCDQHIIDIWQTADGV